MLSPEKKAEMRARLKASLKPKSEVAPTAVERAEEKFDVSRQPIEALAQNYVRAARPFRQRLLTDDAVAFGQRNLDVAIEARKESEAVARAIRRAVDTTCHRHWSDSDANLHVRPEDMAYQD